MDQQSLGRENEKVICVRGLSVNYGSIRALDAVDFECANGEFVGIVGKSGVGKSSFLNALAGFIPFEGIIKVPCRIGYVFQYHSLYPWMTVRQNIAFGVSEMPRECVEARVCQMLEQIDMVGAAERYPYDLSGGQAQRVALARAMAPDPAVLMMDEPMGALDHYTRGRMQDWLLSLWQEARRTALLVTHDVEEALILADRLVIVHEHRFVKELVVPFDRPRTQDLRFGQVFQDLKKRVLSHLEFGVDCR